MPPRTSSSIDRAWAEAFSGALVRKMEPDGEGWLTYAQIKKRFGMGFNRTHQAIARLIKQGRMERFAGLKMSGNKAVREIWYRPKGLDRGKGVKTP